MKRYAVSAVALLALSPFFLANEAIDLGVVSRIRDEGITRSHLDEILSYLTDVSGPRLTNSTGYMKAARWARDRLESWGLENAQLEPWGEFGRGWELEKFTVELTEPYYFPLIAYPKAWTESTSGTIKGSPVRVNIASEEDFDQYRGKLNGAIVLRNDERPIEVGFEADAERYTADSLHELSRAPLAAGRRFSEERVKEYRARRELNKKIDAFLKQEGAAVQLEASRGSHGTVFVGRGGSFRKDEELGIPSFGMSAEHYNLLLRLLKKDDIEVEVAINLQARTLQRDLQGYNVVAEMPGKDELIGDQIVMLGGHLDSWHSATGATDNAAGVAVAMEAVRILRTLGVEPRRTIRIALWGGEEQGLLGSRAYVKNHFGDLQENGLKDAHSLLSAYYNLDNGTGRIRGIYLQGNLAARPIFADILAPLSDLGASTITVRNTGGTDHLAFDEVGLPGFQFIQDPVAYSSRTHHSNMDLYDHALLEDLRQAAVILAAFVYQTAMRDEMIPRKPLPKPQTSSDEPPAKATG